MDKNFKAGIRAMFDSLTYRAANNYHGNSEINAECEKENIIINQWANDALEDCDDESQLEWKSIIELNQQIVELVEENNQLKSQLTVGPAGSVSVNQLIEKLKTFPQDVPVIMASDDEGNSYRFVTDKYVEEGSYSCDGSDVRIGITELTQELEDDGFTDEDVEPNKCVIIG